LGFIGGGNMAAAMIGGCCKRVSRADIHVSETSAERREWLAHEFGVSAAHGRTRRRLAADIIVLAVKPQQLPECCARCRRSRRNNWCCRSPPACAPNDISRWLGGHAAVVRAMPNTPALVGAGIAGLYALPASATRKRRRPAGVLKPWARGLGGQEAQIDAVTAISGSGPAYVFFFIEALEQGRHRAGSAAETARLLTLQTFLGAAALAIKDQSGAGRSARARHLQRRHHRARHPGAGRRRRQATPSAWPPAPPPSAPRKWAICWARTARQT
jgi:pyrroline-5-carboxylate reductase